MHESYGYFMPMLYILDWDQKTFSHVGLNFYGYNGLRCCRTTQHGCNMPLILSDSYQWLMKMCLVLLILPMCSGDAMSSPLLQMVDCTPMVLQYLVGQVIQMTGNSTTLTSEVQSEQHNLNQSDLYYLVLWIVTCSCITTGALVSGILMRILQHQLTQVPLLSSFSHPIQADTTSKMLDTVSMTRSLRLSWTTSNLNWTLNRVANLSPTWSPFLEITLICMAQM